MFDFVLCKHVIIPCSTELIVPRDKSHRKGKRHAKPASCGCGNSSDLVYSNKQRLAKRCLLSCSIVWARVVIVLVERIRMSSDINLSRRSTNSLVRVMRVAWGTTPGILLPRRAAMLHVLYHLYGRYKQVPVTKHGGIRRYRRLGDTKTKLLMRAPCALFQAKSYVEGGSIWTLVTLHRACTIQVLVHAQSQLKLPDCRYHALNFSHSYTPHCFPPPLAPCPTGTIVTS